MAIDLFALALEVKSTGVNEAKTQLASLDKTGRSTAIGLNRIGAEMARTAAQSLGLGSQVGRVAASFAQFGGPVALAVVAGAALIRGGYDLITEGARKAKEQSDALIESLLKERQAQFDASAAGRQAQANAVIIRQMQAEAKLKAVGPRWFGNRNAFDAAQREVTDAAAAFAQAELRVAAAVDKVDKKVVTHTPHVRAVAAAQVDAAAILRDIRARTLQDALRAAGREDDADRARIAAEFDRRDEEYKRLKTSEAMKTALLIASAEERAAALAELETRIAARLARPASQPPTTTANPRERGAVPNQKEFEDMADDTLKSYAESIMQRMAGMGATIRQGIAQTLGDAIYNGFAAAFSGEGLGGVFKAFGKTILAGVGSILTDLGRTWLEYGILMTTLGSALWNPFTSGPAAIAIGAALMALGGALGAVAHGGGGRSAASSGFSGRSSATEDITRIKFVDSRTGNPIGDVTPRSQINVTVIGPNDPSAQRAMKDLIEKSARRAA